MRFCFPERLHSGGSRSQRCNVGGCGREYKTRSQLIRHAAQAHGVALRAGSPRPIMKTRAAIMVHSSLQIRVMRRLCHDLIQPRKAGRNPTWPLNPAVIRQECKFPPTQPSTSQYLLESLPEVSSVR